MNRPVTNSQPGPAKTVLLAGGGVVPAVFSQPGWLGRRIDSDVASKPDLVARLTDLAAIPTASVQAVVLSHVLSTLFAHEVTIALAEVLRVLEAGGVLVIAVADLQAVAKMIVDDRLEEPAYTSPAGPIAPLDIIYGFRPALAAGNKALALHTGFSARSLRDSMLRAGCGSAIVQRDIPTFAIWGLGFKRQPDANTLAMWQREVFPSSASSSPAPIVAPPPALTAARTVASPPPSPPPPRVVAASPVVSPASASKVLSAPLDIPLAVAPSATPTVPVAAGAAALPSVRTTEPSRVNELFIQAVLHHQAGRLHEAERCYRHILALDANNVSSFNNLGMIVEQAGRFPEAEALFRQAASLRPDYIEGFYNLARMLQVQKKFDEAQIRFRHVLTLKPDYAEAHFCLGTVLKAMGRDGDAVGSFKRALALEPEHTGAAEALNLG